MVSHILKTNFFIYRSVSTTEKLVYPGSPQSTLGTFLTLLWAYLDARDVKVFIGRFVMFLSSLYREVCVVVVFSENNYS